MTGMVECSVTSLHQGLSAPWNNQVNESILFQQFQDRFPFSAFHQGNGPFGNTGLSGRLQIARGRWPYWNEWPPSLLCSTQTFPDLRHKAAASAVTFGRDS